jgi:hypothetical protein
MLEGNLTSYRNDLDSPDMCDISAMTLDRPFEKQVGTVYLYQCHIQENR